MMNMTPEQQAHFDAMDPVRQEAIRKGVAMLEHVQANPRTRAKLEKAVALLEELWRECEPLQPTPAALAQFVCSHWADWHEQHVGPLPR